VGHRRLVATLAAMVCVWSILVVVSGRHQPTTLVVMTVQRVEAGQLVVAADLTEVEVPSHLVPAGALTTVAEAVDRMTAAPMPEGAIVTLDCLVSGQGRTSAEGRLIMPVAVSQADLIALIHPGDRISLLVTNGASGQTTVARDVLVVMIPTGDTGGFLGSSGPDHILVDVTTETATLLASSSVTSTITIALG
jgi:Flp pilus assembly protein CpaB